MENKFWHVHPPVTDKNGIRAWMVAEKSPSDSSAFASLEEIGFIASVLRGEDARKIAADHNALLGIPVETVENVGILSANLELFLLDWDRWNDESYAEDEFPKWLLDLAGGLENLDLTRKGESYMDDGEEDDE